jgi:hypothetical protein
MPTPEERKLAEEEATAEKKVDKAGTEAKKEAEDKGASADEVRAAVEKARTEEKDKLYPQIDGLRDAVKEVQEELRKEREEKEQTRKEAEEKAEEERKAKLSTDERQLEILHRLEEQLGQERSERVKLMKELDKKDRQNALNAYRERALVAAGDTILPELKELVTGNTEVEIDTAIKNVKARTEEITKRFKESRGEEVKRNLGGRANPDTAALEEQDLSEQLTQVDKDKYLRDPEYRKQVTQELESAYNRSIGRQ